ncbi:MAG: nucleotidyltransferase domain-containing protein [bacterium]
MDTLLRLLSSRVKAEVFRLLFGLEGGELHVREIARRSALNDATVRQELKRLSALGVIKVRRDGNRAYYSADRLHPLYSDLHSMVLKTNGLVDVLREALWKQKVRLAFVFGSLAGGSETAGSDVDLLVVGSVTLRQLTPRLSGASTRLGREVNPYVLTASEYSKRVRAGDHFLTSVLRAERIFVIGSDHDLEGLGG